MRDEKGKGGFSSEGRKGKKTVLRQWPMRDEKGKESFAPMANEGRKGKREFHANGQ